MNIDFRGNIAVFLFLHSGSSLCREYTSRSKRLSTAWAKEDLCGAGKAHHILQTQPAVYTRALEAWLYFLLRFYLPQFYRGFSMFNDLHEWLEDLPARLAMDHADKLVPVCALSITALMLHNFRVASVLVLPPLWIFGMKVCTCSRRKYLHAAFDFEGCRLSPGLDHSPYGLMAFPGK